MNVFVTATRSEYSRLNRAMPHALSQRLRFAVQRRAAANALAVVVRLSATVQHRLFVERGCRFDIPISTDVPPNANSTVMLVR
jgi:hypothetical protein